MWNALVVLFYVPVALGCLLYLLWLGGLFALQDQIVGTDPGRSVLIGLVAALPLVALSRWLTPRITAFERLSRALARTMGTLGWPSCVLIAASSSIGEELLFRAVIQDRLGIAAGVLLFAAAHVPLERDLLLWPVFALGAGLVFAGLYEATGAVVAPIVCHFTMNLLNLRWISTTFNEASGGTGSATRSRGRRTGELPTEPRRTAGPTGG